VALSFSMNTAVFGVVVVVLEVLAAFIVRVIA
jgi:hypothetical protein